MSSITSNEAAWIPQAKGTVAVGPGPTPNPDENEVVIEVAYAAVNPTDWKMQTTPYFEMDYPIILGTDVAGTVAQVGSKVTRFKIGQRVVGHCDSLLTRKFTNAGYQRFSTVLEVLVSPIPDSVPLANAAVLPLSVDTASAGLFKILDIPFPSLNQKANGKSILIWGGSSSVGSSAIQLAVGAGLTVVATAGAHNLNYVKSLGAKYAFDYKSPTVVEDIMKILDKGDFVFDCVGEDAAQIACVEVASRIGRARIPTVLLPLPSKYESVQVEWVNALDPGLVRPDIGAAIWHDYLPQALAAGKFLPKPDPEIIEGGLSRVQEGIDILKKGVSAKKIVIEIAKKA